MQKNVIFGEKESKKMMNIWIIKNSEIIVIIQGNTEAHCIVFEI